MIADFRKKNRLLRFLEASLQMILEFEERNSREPFRLSSSDDLTGSRWNSAGRTLQMKTFPLHLLLLKKIFKSTSGHSTFLPEQLMTLLITITFDQVKK